MIEVHLSVHELVDFTLRSGSIDSRYFNLETMQAGTRLHNIYQSKQGINYISELPLASWIDCDEFHVYLNGRCDGVLVEDGKVTIEEIKTTNMNLEKFFEENRNWHLGQAVCYGYMYCLNYDVAEVDVCLTYISQNDESIIKKHFHYDFKELENALFSYFYRYFNFQRIISRRRDEMIESLKNGKFPFSTVRKGQEELIEAVDEAIKTKEITFVEAATGIGKTISVIYGCFDELKNKRLDKVFYLCPKNSGFESSLNAFNILKENNYKFVATTLTSKEKMCPFKLDRPCTPDSCPFAKDFYFKENDALFEIMLNESIIDGNVINKYANKFEICPFEFNLDVLLYSDFVVCDLNYVFNPSVYLRRFFEAPDKQYFSMALIDESHNFLSRARDMYSCELSYDEFKVFKDVYKHCEDQKIVRLNRKINKDFKLFMSMGEDDFDMEIQQFDEDFIKNLKNLKEETRIYKSEHPNFDDTKCRPFGLNLASFLKILELVDESFVLSIKKQEENLIVSIKSIDPSKFIRECMTHFESAVFFSATLTPFDFYENSILGHSNFKSLAIESPFDENKFKVLVNNTISVKYKDRETSIDKVHKLVMSYVDAKVGNYLVFVPSFAYLDLLKKYFEEDERFIFQDKNMNSQSISNFLSTFKEEPTETKVGVCVLGGSFSEGIDLIGSRLIGAVVVGVGIPQINNDNDRIKSYYDSIELNGFEYSYTYPGINKVMQAMGRVIRTEDDKGTVLLIDNRLLWTKYKETILKNRNFVLVKSESDVEKELKTFYKK